MISNLTNDVACHRQAANDLAMQREQYLAVGGVIHYGPDFGYRPESASLHYAPDFQRPAVREESNDLADRVRKLAETMTIDEVMAETGIPRGKLRGMGKRYRFNFKRAVGKWTAPNKVHGEKEAALVKHIYECMELKMTQNKAGKHIGISTTLLKRLIRDYQIPYPVVTY